MSWVRCLRLTKILKLMCLPIDFAKAHPEYIAKDNSLGFMSTDNGNSYNLCHCKSRLYCIINFLTCSYLVWSNFEIADMDFWRGPAYTAFFDYLDRQGGFYYEVRACHAHILMQRPNTVLICLHSAGATHQCTR